ncbi:class I SAM-dependent rRNA methyltransferase [Fusibacter tunisiensis]|uniref:23S rRNA (Cytosine1962-C5)-methyltransferase n=1 Tax=Fusibacter tunisiensis TaxID=1008308 RepID=A0ABS2MRP9_9FIRM|nr:class I SAM-dependent rRNA methyltransferase [Fusibacter tunisiensis]MBM7562060.1 23S rRNA (cytosine1962-C5)-methyltransferase [Fusibacter tunisiensis]
MQTLIIHAKYADKYKQGYPLLFKEAIMGNHVLDSEAIPEGTLLKLVDEHRKFLGTAYYGIQNKGIGWVLTKTEKTPINLTFFKRKIYQALEKRLRLFNNPKTNAFRVFNGEGDGIGGLQIDFYNGTYLISYYSKGIYAFNAQIVEALKTSVEYDAIYEKTRYEEDQHMDSESLLVAGSPTIDPLIVRENGVNLNAYLTEGGMTGFFIDQREVRKSLRDKYAKGKTVLNTFSYTGAFSVFAALGGAKQTTSVDLATRSYEKTKRNFEANGIDTDKHEILVEDVFLYFKKAIKAHKKFDVVILDPPSFAKSKEFTFSASKDYPELLKNAIELTPNKGIIIASNNTSTIDLKKFKQIIGRGFNLADARFEILELHQLPQDFRTNRHYEYSNYLKVAIIKVEKKG